MGGFNVGELFGSLILDDSQFTASLSRSGVGATLLTTELNKLKGQIIDLVPDLIKAGAKLEELALDFGLDSEKAVELVETINALSAAEARLSAMRLSGMSAAEKSANAQLEHYASLTEADRIRTTQLQKQYALENDRVSLSNRLRAEELAGQRVQTQATEVGIEQEAAYRNAAIAERATSEASYTGLVTQLRAEEVAAAQVAADEQVALANLIAVGEARAGALALAAKEAEIAAKIKLANQYADAAERTALIEKEAQLSTSGLGLRLTSSGISPRGFIGSGSSGGLLVAGAAAFSAYELVKMTEATADAARTTQNLADRLNIAWEQARGLEQGARLAGVEIGSLQQSAFHLAQALEEGGGAGKKTADALESMGVTGRTSGELLLNFLTNLSKIGDETKRIDLLHDVFQRQSQQLLPYVKNLSDLNALVSQLGPNLNENLSAKLESAAHSFSELGIAWDKLKEKAASGILGTITLKLVTGITSALNTGGISVPLIGLPNQQTLDSITGGGLSKPPNTDQRSASIASQALKDFNDRINRAASQEFRDTHSNLEALKTDLTGVQTKIKEINSSLGDLINPPSKEDRTLLGGELNTKLEEEVELRAKIKALDPNAAGKAATRSVNQAAALEEAQTALNKFADSYNSNVQFLTGEQQAFIEGSFTNLNDILGKGAGTGNLNTFKAALGNYEEALHRFTTLGKQDLAQANLGETISKLWDKLNLAASGSLSDSSTDILTPLMLQIQAKFNTGTSPELLKPFIDEFNHELSELTVTDSKLEEQAKAFGVQYEKAFKMTNKVTEDGNKELAEMMRNLTAIKQLQVTNPQMAAKLEDDFHQSQLRRILGIHDPNTLGQTQQSTLEFLGTDASLRDKQIALVKMFEAMSAVSGETAEKISQDQKIMIDGVVQDYDALKDRIAHNLSIVGNQWRELTNDIRDAVTRAISNLGGALFDTLFPNFLKAGANPLQPLVASFRSAFEQLSAYANPKAALQELIRSIQQAGSISLANAIAVKYFGNTAGPGLAAELRNGTISAKDLAAAIDSASASTTDFANQTTGQLSQLTLLWRQLVKDVVTAIVERLILVGLFSLLTWLKIIKNGTNTLASAMDEVFTKLAGKLVILFGTIGTQISLSVKATAKAVEDAINGINATATIHIVTYRDEISTGQGGGIDPSLLTGGFLSNSAAGGGSTLPGWDINPGTMIDASRVSPGRGSASHLAIQSMTVVTNNPMDFVRQLKALRLT